MRENGSDCVFRPKRIGLIGFDQVTAAHLIGSANAFATAGLNDGFGGRIPCYELHILGVVSRQFDTECGRRWRAGATLGTAPALDTIIVAGGKGIFGEMMMRILSTWLQRRSSETRRIGTICTGAYALAAAGLADGREITTHWRFAHDLASRFPRVKVNPEQSLIHDEVYYSSSGSNAATSLALALIEEDYGVHLARTVAVEIDRRPSATQAGKGQPVPSQHADYHTALLADLISWMLRNLDADLSVQTLARKAGMEPGHFSKTFKSIFGAPPVDFVRNLRLNAARRRLRRRHNSLRVVAASVGFGDPTAFRRALAKRFGERPNKVLSQKTSQIGSPVTAKKALALNGHDSAVAPADVAASVAR
jgi:transcriptional regulator GlxA family with amidase domain